ncbi:ran-binding protein 3-like isoform X3 [Carettochelys insculpta]|uniref:ran-binding protein 3-like isoform X3 n=1 Tax=Carettochelys insculpta TaxID=44489 RepID=UPI003EB7B223
MRNQQVPDIEENAGIGSSYTTTITANSVHHMKDKPHLTKRRGCPSDIWTTRQATGTITDLQKQTNSSQFHSLENSDLNHNDEYYTETSVIAQPIFVFEKKEQSLKRPYEDQVCKAENGPLSQIQHWTVIRPAILQPPQSELCKARRRMCIENTLASSKTKQKANIQMSEESSHWPAENPGNSETKVRPSVSMQFSSPKTIRNQPVEDVTFLNNSDSNFVFGENMIERVLSPQKSPKLHNETELFKSELTSMYAETFRIGYAHTKTFLIKKSALIESAAAHISKPAQKYLLNKVEVITGEEAEHNVLQISCKLFVFNKLSLSWTERGRGSLRLNDTSSNKHGTLQSRLVMRNQGTLKLILNTKLWTQMAIEKPNRKSLCITATDLEDNSVKIFLIQASSKDTEYLYAAIHHRLVALRSFAEQELDANQVDTEPETAFHPLNCDSDDDDDDEDELITQISSNESDHSRWIRRQPVVCS